MMKFPEGFLWGAAASAYQVEGGNANSDWWPWEERAGKERSGQACRHFDLYAQDFDLARDLHHNAHRLSIEWARIEPSEGNFSEEALAHYIQVVQALRARGIEPVVTLHHFTNPVWLSAKGGWAHPDAPAMFVRYAEFVVQGLAPYVTYWTTINEPTIYVSHAFLFGLWPPQAKSWPQARAVYLNMARAHIEAYGRMNAIYREGAFPKPMISIAQHMQAYVPCSWGMRDSFAAELRHKYYNCDFLDRLAAQNTLDFIGLNYYSRQRVCLTDWWPGSFAMAACTREHDPMPKNSLGWDVYPKGLAMLLVKLRPYNLPIMITENGMCTGNDAERWDFIRAHLEAVHRALDQGADVIGYLYWSLLDNFEWAQGFGPRFGLIDVDYQTFKRTVRGSALKFGRVCETGVLE